MTALLNVRDLRAYYGQVQALHGLSFSLNEGSLTTLLGANGAGKTTTLRAICNMVRSTGAIELDGKPLNNRSTESIVRLGIAHVPQGRGSRSPAYFQTHHWLMPGPHALMRLPQRSNASSGPRQLDPT
jgi:branched-chain amino acid transport system ATP-binding protein